jgi:hypothetical protein
MTDTASPGWQLDDQQAWDLAEQVSTLQARLNELLERERVRELELAALRKDVEVKAAYNTMLERAAGENRELIDWLRSRLDDVQGVLEPEHERSAQLERSLDAAARELQLERQRISYRLAQRVIVPVARRPRLFALARRLGRLALRSSSGDARPPAPR